MTWTTERIDELTRLWAQGHSASAIGKQLGVSKNAVVGKAHRLKLTARPSPIRANGPAEGAKPQPSRLRAAALAVDVDFAEEAVLVPAAETDNYYVPPPVKESVGRSRCQWPIGDPQSRDFHFCGEASVPGKPYCLSHCSQAYITKSRNSEAA